MNQPWSPPPIRPFERLQVTNGLLMNAERWRLAHEYHRLRLNAYYQSLYQPGIICGLQVVLIPPPVDVKAEYRDRRWVQVQPGIAIDRYGNFIVVAESHRFRIVANNYSPQPSTVHLVISYVDPEQLSYKQPTEVVRETFQISEKTSPPGEADVELCRILLPPAVEGREPAPVHLEPSSDVFFPGYNHLDLRCRLQARSRPQAYVQLGQAMTTHQPNPSPQAAANLCALVQAAEALYPSLSGTREVVPVSLQETPEGAKLSECNLLYLRMPDSPTLTTQEFNTLHTYLEQGGVLLIEIPTTGTQLTELARVERQLQDALAQVDTTQQGASADIETSDLGKIQQELTLELQSTRAALEGKMNAISQIFQSFSQQLGYSLTYWDRLNQNHPLRTQPFLFAALPVINGQPIQLLTGGGMIILIGELSAAWGARGEYLLPRETIRTAQELGINILNFAWQRRELIQSQQLSS